MTSYKLWILDFCGAKAWKNVLNCIGVNETSGVLEEVPRFLWKGEDICLTTFSNPITGQYEKNVLPDGFGHVSYIGVEGSEEKVAAAVAAIKKYLKIVPA